MGSLLLFSGGLSRVLFIDADLTKEEK